MGSQAPSAQLKAPPPATGRQPPGVQVAACAGGGVVAVWGPGEHTGRLDHGSEVAGVVLFGTYRAVTWSSDGLVILWNSVSGREMHRLPAGRELTSVAVTRRGDKLIMCYYAGTCFVRSSSMEAVIKVIKTDIRWRQQVAVLASDSRLVMWDVQGPATVRDIESGKEICSLSGGSWTRNIMQPFPDDDRVVAKNDDSVAAIWDVAACKRLFVFHHKLPVNRIALFAGGDLMVTLLHAGEMFVWRTATGAAMSLRPSTAHGFVYNFVTFPQADLLATVSESGVALLDPESLEPRRFFGGKVVEVAGTSKGGGVLAMCFRGKATVWSLASGTVLHELFGISEPRKRPPLTPSCVIAAG